MPIQTNISVLTHVPVDSFFRIRKSSTGWGFLLTIEVELSVPLIPPSVLILVRLNIDGEGNPSTGYTKQRLYSIKLNNSE